MELKQFPPYMISIFMPSKESPPKFPLLQALIPLSQSKNSDSLLEWKLVGVVTCQEYGDANCICGHEIKKMYHIQNIRNGNRAVVGSCCIGRVGPNASHLRLRFRSKADYLRSALLMCRNPWERGFVQSLTSKFLIYGSSLRVSLKQANILEKITSKKWRADSTW